MGLFYCTLSGFALALVAPLMVRLLGSKAGYVFAVLPLGLTIYLLQFVGEVDRKPVQFSFAWISELGLAVSFYLDGLSLFFALLITIVGAVVAIYSTGYLSSHVGAFHAYMLSFMASMLGLVLAGNLLTLYLFWELTTITSFLLIGFENEKAAARAAALQALLLTALGGLALLAGLVLLGSAAGSYDVPTLLASGDVVREHRYFTAIVILMLLGAFTKSAQVPFHFWLPAAMEAPAPVSAYLHSATMVKAGVYLALRFAPIFEESDLWTVSLTSVGAVTLLTGAIVAFFAHDLKAILAYLTINVLGTLFMLVGLGGELGRKAAIVYLAAHAAYKGALFLVAGAVEHQTHLRDIRKMKGLGRKMPVTAALAVVSALSMLGMFPLAGFIAKELALEAVWTASFAHLWFTVAMVSGSALLAAAAGLVGIRPFFGRTSSELEGVREGAFSLWLAPALLACASLAMGLFPEATLLPIVEPAVGATLQQAVTLELKWWHGWTVPFALSLTAIAGGVVLYIVRDWGLTRVAERVTANLWSVERVAAALGSGTKRLAAWQTRVLQHGYLWLYVAVVVGVLVLLTGLPMCSLVLRTGIRLDPSQWLNVQFHEAVAVLLIMLAALVTVRSQSRFRAVASLGVIGFSMAWIYTLYGAPDLAMTQIVVEALTVLLFVLAFYHLPHFTVGTPPAARVWEALLAISAGSIVTIMLLVVTNFRQFAPISDYYAQHSFIAAHGRNVVNVILVDFRALDTLGEIIVLAISAVGVFALAKLTGPGGSKA